MKSSLFVLAFIGLLSACNNNAKVAETTTDSSSAAVKADAAPVDTITYPYTATYSSKFTVGNPSNTQLVFKFFKIWEENRLDEMRPLLADSVAVDWADGTTFRGSADSLMKMARQFRSTLNSVKAEMDAFIPVHSVDKNGDWVLIWANNYFTNSKGKKDSTRTQEIYNIENGKIAYWSEYEQKFPKAKK